MNLRYGLLALPVLLAACAHEAPQTADNSGINVTMSTVSSQQLDFALASGRYRCEQGISVDVQRDQTNPRKLQLRWGSGRYQLERENSESGLPRYEDANAGLVWIDLPWKSVLLDGRTGKPLASECRHA